MQRIEIDISDQFVEVSILFADNRFITILKQMTEAYGSLVLLSCISTGPVTIFLKTQYNLLCYCTASPHNSHPGIPKRLNHLRPFDQLFLIHSLPQLDFPGERLFYKYLFDFSFVG